MNIKLLSLALVTVLPTLCHANSAIKQTLDRYKNYLDHGTYADQDWSNFTTKPLSRYDTFLQSFEHFAANNDTIILELGTSRSFTHGGLPGCNQDDPKYWTPESPENWDWGAGFFTRMVAESLWHLQPEIHTVDLIASLINRCRIMTEPYASIITYHVGSSLDILKNWPAERKIDLLYLDTGDMTPIEPTAELQVEEARILVERDLLSPHGLLLIDDVKNQTPKKFGETSDLGKSKYALPYLLAHGFEIITDGYQCILKKSS